jgi:hypothetical protein
MSPEEIASGKAMLQTWDTNGEFSNPDVPWHQQPGCPMASTTRMSHGISNPDVPCNQQPGCPDTDHSRRCRRQRGNRGSARSGAILGFGGGRGPQHHGRRGRGQSWRPVHDLRLSERQCERYVHHSAAVCVHWSHPITSNIRPRAFQAISNLHRRCRRPSRQARAGAGGGCLGRGHPEQEVEIGFAVLVTRFNSAAGAFINPLSQPAWYSPIGTLQEWRCSASRVMWRSDESTG